MITPTDIANILYRDCKPLGQERIPFGRKVTGEVMSERLVIHTKQQQSGRYWNKSFVEINLCVPDLRDGEANTIRLNELERKAKQLLDDVVGSYEGTEYHYSIDSIGPVEDKALKCHYINVRVLFEVLNVK